MILSGCLFEMLFTFKVAHDKHSDTITAFQDKRKWKKILIGTPEKQFTIYLLNLKACLSTCKMKHAILDNYGHTEASFYSNI